jgi:hypothetical protein
MMIQVIDGQVVQDRLPQVGYLSNGESVSGYDLLPNETLTADGWLPSEDNIPAYDETTQILQFDSYTILPDKVIVNYIAVAKPQDVYDYALEQMGV